MKYFLYFILLYSSVFSFERNFANDKVLIDKYLKKAHLDHIVEFEVNENINRYGLYIQFHIDNNVLLTKKEINELIKLHNIGAYSYKYIYNDYKEELHNKFISYDILDFLVKYTIKNKDEYLLKAFLSDMVISRGDGEYAQGFNEDAIIPLLLSFPEVRYYLSDYDALEFGRVIFDDWEVVNGSGDSTQYKLLQNKLIRQSFRLSKVVETHLMGMILAKNNRVSYINILKILDEKKNINESINILKNLINKYNLNNELEKYH